MKFTNICVIRYLFRLGVISSKMTTFVTVIASHFCYIFLFITLDFAMLVLLRLLALMNFSFPLIGL